MSKEILHLPHTQPHSLSLEIIAPLSTRMLFCRARYLNRSAFLCHVPFLFWLIEASRPKIFVELGVGDGVSYFAACQAIDKLDLDARCHGVALKDVEANIPASVSNYNTQHYGDFSQLHTEDMREVVNQFSDGSIDLLHIDMDTQDESILDSLSHDWVRKLSPQGIVLLHGVTSRFSDIRSRKFLDRLIASYPSITLRGGEGLTAVLYGEERQERLVKMADLTFGMAGYSEVHHVFNRLGAAHSFEWTARDEAETAAKMRKACEISANGLQKSEEQRETLQKRVEALDSAYDARTEQIAVLQGKLFDLQVAQEKKDGVIAELTVEHGADRAELSSLRVAFEKAQAEQVEAIAIRDAALADSQQAVEDLKAQMTTRFNEIAILTRMLQTLEEEQVTALAKEKQVRESEVNALNKTLATRENDMRVLHKRLDDVNAHRDALLNSTSWKLTHPMRIASKALRK